MNTTYSRSRRAVLKAVGAAALVGAAGTRRSFAADRIAAATFPGAWETAHRSFLIPAFEKASGGSVNLMPTMPLEIIAKTAAARNNPHSMLSSPTKARSRSLFRRGSSNRFRPRCYRT